MYTENSGFASPSLGRHISTFRGYWILFSIRNPYINRFTNNIRMTYKWVYDFAYWQSVVRLTYKWVYDFVYCQTVVSDLRLTYKWVYDFTKS
jgi:hypothetical protein